MQINTSSSAYPLQAFGCAVCLHPLFLSATLFVSGQAKRPSANLNPDDHTIYAYSCHSTFSHRLSLQPVFQMKHYNPALENILPSECYTPGEFLMLRYQSCEMPP